MKKIFMLCFMLVVVFMMICCNAKENTNLNKEQIKEELNGYVNEIEKSEIIQNNFSYVNEIVGSIDNMTLKKEDNEQIIKTMKKQIDDIILNKDLEKTIINDYHNSKYKKIYNNQLYENCRCYGLYNEAVVLFLPLEEQVESTIVVENFEFYYSSYFAILVWHNGIFYSFEVKEDVNELLDKNILKTDDIENINKIHKKWAN